MKIVLIGNDNQKEELAAQGVKEGTSIEIAKEPGEVADADCYIDLLFTNTKERIASLKQLQPAIIIINAIIDTSLAFPQGFIRMNGWNTFLKRPVAELATGESFNKETVAAIFANINKTIEWVPDVPGFISPRVISMIINEAYFALEDNVSSREEIDTAMKLGTNYPYGPFEWTQRIGINNIYTLLSFLSQQNTRYTPAYLLKQEALSV